MDKRYEAYCLADRHFYDAPIERSPQQPDFELLRRPTPRGCVAGLRRA